MKYALIGCGRIAANHLKSALENGLDIVCFCDLEAEKCRVLLEQYHLSDKGIGIYTDYREMILQHPELSLVAVATSSGAHAEIALFCIGHHLHVILEKPVALRIEDADEIILKAKEMGVKVCACHQNRFNTAISKTRDALEAGRFGKLSHGAVAVRWFRDKAYYGQAAWRGTWAQDGGCLTNQCIHGIDLLRWMMGDEIDSVYGIVRNRVHPYLAVEDIGMAVISFKNGAVGTVEGTVNVSAGDMEETLSLFGETGTVKLGGTCVNNIDFWHFSQMTEQEAQTALFKESAVNVYGNGHGRLYADMIDAILHDRAPYVDATAGRNALEAVQAIYLSAFLGKPVKLPLTKCAMTDFEAIFSEEHR